MAYRFGQPRSYSFASFASAPPDLSALGITSRTRTAGFPQRGMSAPKRSLTQKVSDTVSAKLAPVIGQRMADKVAGLFDFTPAAGLTQAYDAGAALRQNKLIQGGIEAASGLLSVLPDGGATAGKVLHSIIAPLWHGSAAKFERFADDFIGSGEGAQGYGYGHYLSESKRLANSYRKPKLGEYYPPEHTGHLYEVKVNADEPDFLNMNAPLATQPPAVQEFAKSVDLSGLPEGRRARVVMERFKAGRDDAGFPATGEILHNAITNYGADTEANRQFSEMIRQRGYAGLQYGQPVNGLGGGGRNYVVFDPSIIDILNRH